MKDLRLRLGDMLRNDATLQAILGGTPTDPRVYNYYEGDATVGPDIPAYVTISNIATPETGGAVLSPIFSFVIWARRQDTVEAVRDRLCGVPGTAGLLHKQIIVTDPPASQRWYGKRTAEQDSFQHQPNFTGKTVHFRFSRKEIP